MTAELRHVTGDDVVVGIGGDAELETHTLQRTERAHHLGKGRHLRDARGQDLGIAPLVAQPELGHTEAQALGGDGAECAMRFLLLERKLMPVKPCDEARGIDGRVLLAQDPFDRRGLDLAASNLAADARPRGSLPSGWVDRDTRVQETTVCVATLLADM
jgi:hypothetical protein